MKYSWIIIRGPIALMFWGPGAFFFRGPIVLMI